jgi:hypothetical protein
MLAQGLEPIKKVSTPSMSMTEVCTDNHVEVNGAKTYIAELYTGRAQLCKTGTNERWKQIR